MKWVFIVMTIVWVVLAMVFAFVLARAASKPVPRVDDPPQQVHFPIAVVNSKDVEDRELVINHVH